MARHATRLRIGHAQCPRGRGEYSKAAEDYPAHKRELFVPFGNSGYVVL